MSSVSVSQFFNFCNIRITNQESEISSKKFVLGMHSDNRHCPHCSHCGTKMQKIHSTRERYVRDLSLSEKKVFIHLRYFQLFCPQCHRYRVEKFDFLEPSNRYTFRFARYVHSLCKLMTVKEVSEHLDLDWKTVKNIDKHFLEEEFGDTIYDGLSILMIDEISIKKRKKYLTVIVDYATGRIVWMGKDHWASTLDSFFEKMTDEQRKAIKAVALDMWDPYIKSVRQNCPNAKIVFDLFHVVKQFNRAMNTVRNREYRNAKKEHKKVIKGSRYILLKGKRKLNQNEKQHLKELIEINKNISTTYILKDLLKELWKYKYLACAKKALAEWTRIAKESGIPEMIYYARRLNKYSYGIINHCKYQINSGKIEGTNNTLKVIKRSAYGYLDPNYFILKCKQAFPGK